MLHQLFIFSYQYGLRSCRRVFLSGNFGSVFCNVPQKIVPWPQVQLVVFISTLKLFFSRCIYSLGASVYKAVLFFCQPNAFLITFFRTCITKEFSIFFLNTYSFSQYFFLVFLQPEVVWFTRGKLKILAVQNFRFELLISFCMPFS